MALLLSAGAFKIVLQKDDSVDFEKSQVLACLVSQEQEKQQRCLLLAQVLGSGSQVLPGGRRTGFRLFPNDPTACLWVSDVLYMLTTVLLSSDGATRRLPGQEGASGTF